MIPEPKRPPDEYMKLLTEEDEARALALITAEYEKHDKEFRDGQAAISELAALRQQLTTSRDLCGEIRKSELRLRQQLADAQQEINHWKIKAECYGNMVQGCSPVLASAGYPVDGTIPGGAVEGIAISVKALVAERDAALKRLKEAGEAWKEYKVAREEHDTYVAAVKRLDLDVALADEKNDANQNGGTQ